MYALFLVLNDIYKLDDVLEVFYDHHVGATTIDSIGMGKVLLEHNEKIPMFSSIRKMLEGNKPYNKTIISVIRDKEELKKITKDINSKIHIEDGPGKCFMFVVPVMACFDSKHVDFDYL